MNLQSEPGAGDLAFFLANLLHTQKDKDVVARKSNTIHLLVRTEAWHVSYLQVPSSLQMFVGTSEEQIFLLLSVVPPRPCTVWCPGSLLQAPVQQACARHLPNISVCLIRKMVILSI